MQTLRDLAHHSFERKDWLENGSQLLATGGYCENFSKFTHADSLLIALDRYLNSNVLVTEYPHHCKFPRHCRPMQPSRSDCSQEAFGARADISAPARLDHPTAFGPRSWHPCSKLRIGCQLASMRRMVWITDFEIALFYQSLPIPQEVNSSKPDPEIE